VNVLGEQDKRVPERTVDRIVIVGRIGGAFGVAGWVKVGSYTVPPENLLHYRVWRLLSARNKDDWTAAHATQGRVAGNVLHVKLEGIETREQAAALCGFEIGIRRDELPQLPEGEYYWDDLIGLDASSLDGERLGEIVEVRAAPAHPLLRVIDKNAGKTIERWVPLVRERIKSVDLTAGRAVLDWQRDW
jgi:16S rRNA processing protein RimM